MQFVACMLAETTVDIGTSQRKIADAKTSSRAVYSKASRGYDLISLQYERGGGDDLQRRDEADAQRVAKRGANCYYKANTHDVVAGRSRRDTSVGKAFLPNIRPDPKSRNVPRF